MGTLSVKENLYFSAALRLPTSMPWKEKKNRVAKVIEDLGLTNCCDTKVQCYIWNKLRVLKLQLNEILYSDWSRSTADLTQNTADYYIL